MPSQARSRTMPWGILRSTGEAERSLFLIDKQGIIRYIDVHDINSRPGPGPADQGHAGTEEVRVVNGEW